MHPRIILAIARKDALDIWLNKATLGGLLYPIIMSLVFLLLSKLVGSSATNIIVYDPGESNVVPVVLSAFPRSQVTQASSAAEVITAFQPDTTIKKSPYAAGLIISTDFDNALRSGERTQLHFYINGSTVNAQTRKLVQAAVENYGRTIAQPQPPVEIVTTMINPPSTENAGITLSRFYAPLALLLSLIIGTTFVPQLLIEEKEKKTLRMLMVTPASFEDVLLGKLLVVLIYQLILSCVVLAIQGGFTGQIGLILLYVFLGGCFSLALGLLFGAVFDNASTAATVEGIVMVIYIIAGIFVGPMGEVLAGSNKLVLKIAAALPTYYIADGVYKAAQNLGSLGNHMLDTGVILGSTILLFAISVWVLRRQSAVAAMI